DVGKRPRVAGERVQNIAALGRRELHQAQLVGAWVETGRLGVQAQPVGPQQRRQGGLHISRRREQGVGRRRNQRRAWRALDITYITHPSYIVYCEPSTGAKSCGGTGVASCVISYTARCTASYTRGDCPLVARRCSCAVVANLASYTASYTSRAQCRCGWCSW